MSEPRRSTAVDTSDESATLLGEQNARPITIEPDPENQGIDIEDDEPYGSAGDGSRNYSYS